jgi:mannose/cellobiose epimerase-like protein (N-acyl-D-glucosamine 2-epimerase family)
MLSEQHQDDGLLPSPRQRATSSRPGHITEAARVIARRWAEAHDKLKDAEDELGLAHKKRNAAEAEVEKIIAEAKDVVGLKLGEAFCVAFDDHVVNMAVASRAVAGSRNGEREIINVHFERLARL